MELALLKKTDQVFENSGTCLPAVWIEPKAAETVLMVAENLLRFPHWVNLADKQEQKRQRRGEKD